MIQATVATIGFTQTSAEHFFDRLRQAGVRKVVDVRLHNTSQLAGFAKSDDLAYFLRALAGIDYTHMPELAPDEDILKGFKTRKGDWGVYRGRFIALMEEREVARRLTPAMLDGACLLCSEPEPHHCHRQIVCDYLNAQWNGALGVRHL